MKNKVLKIAGLLPTVFIYALSQQSVTVCFIATSYGLLHGLCHDKVKGNLTTAVLYQIYS